MTMKSILTFTAGAVFSLTLMGSWGIWTVPVASAVCLMESGPHATNRLLTCLERERFQQQLLMEEERQSDVLERLELERGRC